MPLGVKIRSLEHGGWCVFVGCSRLGVEDGKQKTRKNEERLKSLRLIFRIDGASLVFISFIFHPFGKAEYP